MAKYKVNIFLHVVEFPTRAEGGKARGGAESQEDRWAL